MFYKKHLFLISKAFAGLKSITKNTGFFIPYIIFLIIGLWLILQFSEKDILDLIISFRTPALTSIAKILTHAGDGLFFIAVIVTLVFFKLRYSFTALVAWAVQGLTIQLSKRYIFDEYTRPVDRLKDSAADYIIEGYQHHSLYSFPSGHASTAFCLFLLLALFSANKRLGILFFIFAFIVALTRPYLAQHFFIDIYAGSIIGSLSAIIAYIFIYKPDIIHNHPWLDKSVLKIKG